MERRRREIESNRRKLEKDGAMGGKSFMELQDAISRLHKAMIRDYTLTLTLLTTQGHD